MNPKNILGIVLAHGKAVATCVRHLPVWLQSCDRVIFVTPCNDRLCLEDIAQYSVGVSAGRYDASVSFRCREALRFASLTDYTHVALFEYDSLIFGEFPDMGPAGVMAPMIYPFEPQFKGRGYPHFPQLYTRDAARRVVKAMDTIPLAAEQGFTDRYVGLAIQEAGLQISDVHRTGLAYTENHITRDKLEAAVVAYSKGARWSHGIKDQIVFETLETAAKAYAEAHRSGGT
jgi:hypothetical protein